MMTHAEYMDSLEAASYEGLEKARTALWSLLEQNPDRWVVLLGEHCNYRYRGKDNRTSSWPTLHKNRPAWPAAALKMQVRDLDPCVWCLEPTFYGSGRFVNRTPADCWSNHDLPPSDPANSLRDGYACAACMARECDHCDEDIPMDEDFRHPRRATDPQPDGFYHYDGSYHYECLTALGFTEKQIEKGQE